jgi:succinate dehydrogenase/fumarate reductase flavoprotein subunit
LSENLVETDVLVIGGGTAGCFAAIKAREQGLDVTIIDKGYAGKSGASITASGGWAVFNTEWGFSLDASINEINKSGEYLNNREWSEIVLKESWSTYQDLISWGVEFPVEADKVKDFFAAKLTHRSQPDLPKPAFGLVPLRHRKTTPFLRKQAEKVGIKVMDRIMVTDLLKQNGKVVGAIGFLMESYDLYIFKAKVTILTAGRNTFKAPGMNISGVTGDADGMAYRAGAEITGKEFPDLHTSLAIYPAWKSTGELYPAFWYYTDSEGKPITVVGMDLGTVAVIHAGRGPVLWDFDAATPEDLDAIDKYKWKRGNPVERLSG